MISLLITILIIVLIVGAICYGISYLPFSPPIKNIAYFVLAIVLLLWLVSYLNLAPGLR